MLTAKCTWPDLADHDTPPEAAVNRTRKFEVSRCTCLQRTSYSWYLNNARRRPVVAHQNAAAAAAGEGRVPQPSQACCSASPRPASDSPTRPRFVCAPLPWLKYQGCITFIAVSGNCAPRTEWTPQRRTPAAGHARRLRASHAVRPATLPARSRRDRDAEAGKRRAGRGGIGRSRGTDRWRGVLTFGAGHWRLMRAAVRGTNERRGPSLP